MGFSVTAQFEPNDRMRRKVAIAAAGGMSHEEIAIALGISRPTLTKYFEAELSHGAYKRRMDVLNAMHRAAIKGNVAAQKAFLSTEPALSTPPLEPDPPAAAADQPKLGKKDQADADAKTAHHSDPEWRDLLDTKPTTLQ